MQILAPTLGTNAPVQRTQNGIYGVETFNWHILNFPRSLGGFVPKRGLLNNSNFFECQFQLTKSMNHQKQGACSKRPTAHPPQPVHAEGFNKGPRTLLADPTPLRGHAFSTGWTTKMNRIEAQVVMQNTLKFGQMRKNPRRAWYSLISRHRMV